MADAVDSSGSCCDDVKLAKLEFLQLPPGPGCLLLHAVVISSCPHPLRLNSNDRPAHSLISTFLRSSRLGLFEEVAALSRRLDFSFVEFSAISDVTYE